MSGMKYFACEEIVLEIVFTKEELAQQIQSFQVIFVTVLNTSAWITATFLCERKFLSSLNSPFWDICWKGGQFLDTNFHDDLKNDRQYK